MKKYENQRQNAACEQKNTNEKENLGSNKKLSREWTMSGLGKSLEKIQSKSYPADCRRIGVDSNKHDWDWKNRYSKKKDFCTKTFFKSDLFWWHFVVEHNSVSERGYRVYYQYQ